MNKKYLTILIHLFGWTAFFVFPFVLLNFPAESHATAFREARHSGQRPALLPFFLINNLLFIIFFYLNLFYLLPSLFYRRKKVAYFAVILLLLLLAVYLPSFIKRELIPHPETFIRSGPERPSGDTLNVAVNNGLPPGRAPGRFRDMDRMFGFLHFLIIWFLSSIICLAQRYRRMEQRNKEMKVQKLDAELSYLKAQINPHFLFNTLNNIYSLSICQSEQTPEAILKLSAIMRYVTQDAEAEKVPLEKELDYLKNYIDLQQLRSNDMLEVKFIITGDSHNKIIAPLLLINFIENAFKHGISNHVACFVAININIINDQLTMEVVNKKFDQAQPESIATGSNNTNRRLQLQYPDKHIIAVEEKDELYKVTLQLNLS
ncbi:MAG: sensor histidine kinase [Ferruginibacter sp.]